MKDREVLQDNIPQYYEGLKKGYYALNDEGKYVIVPSLGWDADEVINGLAANEITANLEETRKAVLAGLKSPLCYHREVRQTTPEILAKTANTAKFRVKRHFRPDFFVKLKPSVLVRYAEALAITPEELKTVPHQSQEG
jgi:hypothetical protein